MNFSRKRNIVKLKNHPFGKIFWSYFEELYLRTLSTNQSLRKQTFQVIPYLVGALITGTVAFLYSRIFSLAEHGSILLFEYSPLSVFVITPLSFVLSWWIAQRFAPYTKGSGIPQVMAALELEKPEEKSFIRSFVGFKVILVKIFSSAIKVLGGGIVGREGPTIQIGSSIFLEIKRALPKWWINISEKNMLIAGAASGLASAFNTPLGGVIFAIEELSKFHIKYYKTPLFIAVITAGLTAQGLGGSYLYLGTPKTGFEGLKVIVGIVIVGVLGGYLGSKMCVLLLKFMQFFGKITSNPRKVLVIILCGLWVATTIYFLGFEAMGSGKEIMERVLFTNYKSVEWYLPLVRIVGLMTSFGFGGAGGVFAPSLSTGATVGAYVSQLLHLTGGNANLLILIGMTAFLTGVTRAPFTSAIIIFEMTDRHSIIFFLLIGGFLANIIANFVSSHSFYDQLKDLYLKDVKEKIEVKKE
ncbi:chloride channel protein [Flectobacillus longus]|uniref:chloride channel protein n=1 Tax=Flectobacillus longus TaxID=2984207 RepID=UPI0024B7AB44|nr:chloride channel protein [Flectobacillus longus]MDI9882392.1 chloride channel protein [Flectobacillus longus]